jgi:hypothetical protein
MRILHTFRRWYRLHRGQAKQMRNRGAVVRSCPHCCQRTPVYHSKYTSVGEPLTFTVCLWCDGLIEYQRANSPQKPYTPRHSTRKPRSDWADS